MQQQLPPSPDLSHLKKQAKSLLKSARAGDLAALQRFIDTLPAARNTDLATLASRELKLHDAHSVVAREHGFKSWLELSRYVEWTRTAGAERIERWLRDIYTGNAAAQRITLRVLREQPGLFRGDPWVACATGDVDAIRSAIAANASWVNTTGGPLAMPPLVAVTHSRLIAEPDREPKLLAGAKLLLDAGANVDSAWINPAWPDGSQSALYGAAGITHNVAMTTLLLDAGANPNDNESLYHSVESRDSTCTRLLLRAGVRVNGTNALARVLDFDKLEDLRAMLEHGGDVNERPLVHHAILRGRSIEHIRLLFDAGADLRRANEHGVSLFRFAHAFGRADVVELLRAAGVDEPLDETELFVSACARGDESAARAMLATAPDLISRLTTTQLQAMPELAGTGNIAAVRTMLAVGWPREVKTAWDATALNLAVFRGDAEMAELLLNNGADWRTRHGYNDNVIGTLSFASVEEPMEQPAPHDYEGCARALLAHGVPVSDTDAYGFSDEVIAIFDEWREAMAGVRVE
jgi:ankyrin repeat protein